MLTTQEMHQICIYNKKKLLQNVCTWNYNPHCNALHLDLLLSMHLLNAFDKMDEMITGTTNPQYYCKQSRIIFTALICKEQQMHLLHFIAIQKSKWPYVVE